MYRLPVNNKRTGSLHLKKLSSIITTNEDDPRIHSSTPQTILPKKTPSKDQSSPSTKIKLGLLHHMFETPKLRQDNRRNLSLAESNNSFNQDSIEKIKRPHFLNFEDGKKPDEKYLTTIISLTRENEKLKIQLESLNHSKNLQKKRVKIWKNLKDSQNNSNQIIEKFVKIVREEIDKLSNILLEKAPESLSEIGRSTQVFNEGLKTLKPLIGQNAVELHQFVAVHDSQQFRNTGKFKSLGQSKESLKALEEGPKLREVVAMADFQANVYGQLQFKVGDRIQLIKTDDSEWWLGKIGEKVGRIPSQFVMLD